jgi:archaellum component FlaG (FlaF/FlaG flagellin family)
MPVISHPFILFIATLLLTSTLLATTYDSTSADEVAWQLQGEATFRWTVIRVYDGRFYLSDSKYQSDPLNRNVSRKLRFGYNVSISADKIAASGTELLRQNLTNAEWESIAEDVERINQAYRDVSSGDSYELVYLKNSGTRLFMNEEELVQIESPDFGSLYFRIWLGEKPMRASFRDQLLGR